ncbi:hypothetical protein NNJEOMEG_02272 [Fundidesulfovibrio magnetotacticus]|uniref:Mu-like prophage FluMu N-terminal domain-containing protein n=1 Tax=Fundidesulfovibrio magnetotacticus TaxID=2730080 RepID=A0A6V8LXQ4_9BACT|nr:HI1506-related protein [Fundidesulfovibrio magnetotacticus]GFK94427.1 hypothetical protein NNJEOMEG_02272 [Fundidesulfovibrio magnetotacticus]
MDRIDTVVITRSLRGGHFRAGVPHGAEEKPWPSGTFSAEQLKQLRADPDLAVRVLEASAPRETGVQPSASWTPEVGTPEDGAPSGSQAATVPGEPESPGNAPAPVEETPEPVDAPEPAKNNKKKD